MIPRYVVNIFVHHMKSYSFRVAVTLDCPSLRGKRKYNLLRHTFIAELSKTKGKGDREKLGKVADFPYTQQTS